MTLASLVALPAWAGPDEEKKDDKKEEKDGDKKADKDKDKDKKKDEEPKKDPLDPKEDPAKAYLFLGVRYRHYIVPDFIFGLFAAGGKTTDAWSIGGEFTYRKNGLELDVSLSYANYGLDNTMFKGKNDSDFAYEIVQSNIKLANLELDLLFDFPIDKAGRVSFLVGGGVGFGIITGNLRRNQAYPTGGGAPDPKDPSKWTSCTGVGDPQGGAYCDNANNHFGNLSNTAVQNGTQPYSGYQEPDWVNGGSLPTIFPILVLPQLSLRVKPIKQLAMRIDTGFSVSGFILGASAAYGF